MRKIMGWVVMVVVFASGTVARADAGPLSVLWPAYGASLPLGSQQSIKFSYLGAPPVPNPTFEVMLFKDGVKIGDIATKALPYTNPADQNPFCQVLHIPWTVGNYIGGVAGPGSGYRVDVKVTGAPIMDDGPTFAIVPVKWVMPSQQQSSTVGYGQRPPVAVAVNLPDLTAAISFTPRNPYQKEGVTCYSVQPTILIVNQGKGAAKSFEYLGEWSFSSTPNVWQVFTSGAVDSLGGGKTHTVVGPDTASVALTWCPSDAGTPGYRITIDAKKAVRESIEDNNIVEKRYRHLPVPPSLRK